MIHVRSFRFDLGLLILNLDRFIVSTIKKRDSFRNELLQASPRVAPAIIIAVVISKPLETKIFEKEINQVLLEQKTISLWPTRHSWPNNIRRPSKN